MDSTVLAGIMIPFLGTLLGSACVYFMKGEMKESTQKMLAGFASGVMVAASVWSLLIPSLDQSQHMGTFAFVPASVGFLFGILFLLALDHLIPHIHAGTDEIEGPHVSLKKTTLMVLAVTLHNIPEGMAVGVLYAGWMQGNKLVSFSAAVSLAVGIAIQNFPEGAIISMPLHANGMSKGKACVQGILSGAVEPVAGFITILLASLIVPFMPVLLSFAAGAMVYVVVEELVPEMAEGQHSNWTTFAFMIGFAGMMVLDVVFG